MALRIAAIGMVVIGLLAHRIRLPSGDADLEPSNHWPEPLTEQPVDNDRGPVMIQVEYQVAPEQRPAFLAAIHQLSAARRRDGAYLWGVAEDTRDPGITLEWFLIESWGEHLRQHRRVSKADAELQHRLRACLQHGSEPIVRHFVALARSR
jgi:quinol monooxygenase YgiN